MNQMSLRSSALSRSPHRAATRLANRPRLNSGLEAYRSCRKGAPAFAVRVLLMWFPLGSSVRSAVRAPLRSPACALPLERESSLARGSACAPWLGVFLPAHAPLAVATAPPQLAHPVSQSLGPQIARA